MFKGIPEYITYLNGVTTVQLEIKFVTMLCHVQTKTRLYHFCICDHCLHFGNNPCVLISLPRSNNECNRKSHSSKLHIYAEKSNYLATQEIFHMRVCGMDHRIIKCLHSQ